MKKIIYMFILAISINSMTITAFANSFDTNSIPKYSERQYYYIDRGEFSSYVAELYKSMSQKELPESQNNFIDIDVNMYPEIPKIASLGIMVGTGENQFSPASTLTNKDLCQVIVNTIKAVYPEIDTGENAFEFAVTRGIISQKIDLNSKVTLGATIDAFNKTLNSAPNFEATVVFEKESPVTYDKIAYLTFDDGVSANTIKILDTLKEYNIKATFYLTGETDPAILKRMVDEGHAIGNHTYSHDYEYIYSSVENFFKDFYKEEAYLESIIGYKPTLVRLPGGSNNTVSHKYGGSSIMKEITAELTKRGYIYTDWNSEAKDATTENITPEQVKQNIFSTVSKNKNAVVLMHQTVGKEATAEALPSVIEEFKKLGFGFDKISETSFNTQFTLK